MFPKQFLTYIVTVPMQIEIPLLQYLKFYMRQSVVYGSIDIALMYFVKLYFLSGIEVRSTIDTHYKIIRNNIMAFRTCDDFCLNNKRLGNTQFAVGIFCCV